MKPFRLVLLLPSLLIALTLGVQNCKKSDPDPVKPPTTNPGSTTTTPGTSTTTTPGTATATSPTFNSATISTTSGITSTSATVSAVIDANGGAAISQHGFVYSKTIQLPTLADSKTEKGATTGPFPLTISSGLTNLEANTTYYVRAYAINEKGTSYGAVGQLKLGTATNVSPDTPPTVETNEPTGVSTTSAQFSMQVTEPGGSNIRLDSYGILYDIDRTRVDNGVGSSLLLGQSTFGKLSGSLTNLVPYTTYYARAYAIYTLVNQPASSAKAALGKVVTFKTGSENLTGSWTKLAGETPYKLGSGSFLQVSGSLAYMAEPRTGKFYSYNPSNGEVATLSPYVTTNAASYNDEFDGFTLGTAMFMLYSDPQNSKLSLFQAYYPAQQTWVAKAPFSGSARLGACL